MVGVGAKLSDAEIEREWRRITWMARERYPAKGGLALLVAAIEADKLEARGVTEADIDRLFPSDQPQTTER